MPDGHKFAALALRVEFLVPSTSLDSQPVSNLHFLLAAPLHLSDRWQEWLGSLRVKEVAESNLFLIQTKSSKTPGVLDDENLRLTKDLERLYFALLMTVPYIGHSHATMMTGVREGSTVDIRQIQTLEGVYCPPGCSGDELDSSCLKNALQVRTGITTLQTTEEHNRLWRVINAFYTGLKAPKAGKRVHEFIRCLEGFVFPSIGKTRKHVVHRARLFIDPPQDDVIGTLFDIRSSVEHLHDPFRTVAGRNLNEKNVALAERAYQAEIIARHCLSTLLLRERLWPHFKDDDALSAFWTTKEAERRALWGTALDWNLTASRFDRKRAAMAMSSP